MTSVDVEFHWYPSLDERGNGWKLNVIIIAVIWKTHARCLESTLH